MHVMYITRTHDTLDVWIRNIQMIQQMQCQHIPHSRLWQDCFQISAHAAPKSPPPLSSCPHKRSAHDNPCGMLTLHMCQLRPPSLRTFHALSSASPSLEVTLKPSAPPHNALRRKALSDTMTFQMDKSWLWHCHCTACVPRQCSRAPPKAPLCACAICGSGRWGGRA